MFVLNFYAIDYIILIVQLKRFITDSYRIILQQNTNDTFSGCSNNTLF